MTREEDLIRSTTHAIAAAVRDVPPLRLSPVADELSSPARAPRSGWRGLGPGRWGTWLIPLTAAAAVVALAVSLAVVKNLPNGSAAHRNPAASATGSASADGVSTTSVDGAPRYYTVLQQYGSDPGDGVDRQELIVGDSLTGKLLATLKPPAQTSFVAARGAADDLTFAVEAVRSSTGSFSGTLFNDGGTLTASWYALRLAPGTAHPARLVPLPVAPQSWVIPKPAPQGPVFAGQTSVPMALSQSGQELALGDMPKVETINDTGVGVRVVSVATGQVLHHWATADPHLSSVALGSRTGMTWIDNDQALALAVVNGGRPTLEQILRLNVAGPATGDLVADSQVISSAPESGSSPSCFRQDSWVPFVTAVGNTAACSSAVKVGSNTWRITVRTDILAIGSSATGTRSDIVDQPEIDYQFTETAQNLDGRGPAMGVLWANPSGDTLIAEWVSFTKAETPYNDEIGVVSHGKFTPLRFPASFSQGRNPITNLIADGDFAW